MHQRNPFRPLYLLLILTSLVLFLGGCGKVQEETLQPSKLNLSQIIVGSLDWIDYRDLSDGTIEKEVGRAVGYVYIPQISSRCTGFLISDDILMTNQHCVPEAADAAGIRVSFNKEGTGEREVYYDCSEFIGNNAQLDFALLRCDGSPGQYYGHVDIDYDELSSRSIYVVQQNCDYYNNSGCTPYKILGYGEITNTNNYNQEYTHNADTLGGSSGSPVFSKASHKVVAIHHAGRGNDGKGRGVENYAVPMSRVVADIATRFPNIYDIMTSGSSQDDPSDPPPPTSSDQEFEPNNSFEEAIAFNEYLNNAVELSVDEGDMDFFKYNFQQRGKLKITISFSHAQGDLDMKLYSSSKSMVAQSTSTSNQEVIELDVTSSTYYLKVYGYAGAVGDYQLSATFVPEAPTYTTMQTAQSIRVPFSKSGETLTTTASSHYYRFNLTLAQSLFLKINFNHSAGDLDLYLLDSNGNRVAKSNGVTNAESISTFLYAGTYYIHVVGYSGATGEYSISVY